MAPDILDLDLVVRRLVADARSRVSADAVAVWLLGPDGSELALHTARGFRHAATVPFLAHRPAAALGEWLTSRRPPGLTRVTSARAPGRAWLAQESIRSVLAVPLVAGGIRIGLLAAFRRRRAFTRAHLARVRELGAAGGPAMHAALRFAEEREHAERAEMLLAVTQALASTSDLPAALEEVANRTAAALGADRCEIELADAAVPPGPAAGGDIRLAVPIGREYDAIGWLRLERSEHGVWAPKTVELATAIASQIALAAENVRLVRQTEAHAGELAALHDVATRLTSTLDLPTVLEGIADAARTLIGARLCGVFELDAAQRLVPRTSRGVPLGSLLTLDLGQGAVGAAALRRAPFFTPDWRAHEPPGYGTDRLADGTPLRDAVGEQGMSAILAVPLVSRDVLVGVIAVAWEEAHAYDEREVRLLTGLAQQAAVALGHARAHSAAVRRADELGALLRAARTVMAGLDPKSTLEQIVHEAAGIADTPDVTVHLVDTEANTLRVGAQTGSATPFEGDVPAGTSYPGVVAASGEPFFAADAGADPRNPLREHDRRMGIVTYLGFPIRFRERVLGVLSFHTTAPRRYSPADLEYFGSFADLAGIALGNAGLYDEAQQALADLKTVQQKLVQGETLRALGELAGGAAHHLNNLLTIVVGRAQLLLRNVEDERLRRPLTIIEKAAKDGAEVVRRLQQFSRTRHVTRTRAVSLDDVVRDALAVTRGHWQDGARARGVSIDVDAQLGGVPPVDGDPAALREAVTNLLRNAVDAMPTGGRLTVTTRADGDRVSLVIGDTGTGMPESVRRRAHEPFFTTKGVKAMGLGLSVAYGIVRSHGGELALESAEGRGTTIALTLPRAPTSLTAPPRAPEPRPGALRLLLVDDEDDVREALAEMLASHGHVVLIARGAEEALALVETEPDLDVVLADVVMPSPTGWDVAAGVKTRRPGLPVGLITGWGEAADIDDALRTMVDFVVEKPVSVEMLQDAVARARGR